MTLLGSKECSLHDVKGKNTFPFGWRLKKCCSASLIACLAPPNARFVPCLVDFEAHQGELSEC